MILSNSQSKQQNNPNQSLIHKKQVLLTNNQPLQNYNFSDIIVYPCCLQISYHKQNQQLNKDHKCFKKQNQSFQIKQFNPIKLNEINQKYTLQKNTFNNKNMNINNLRKKDNLLLICSLCQKNQQKYKNLQFSNCLNCQKIFCKDCCNKIHQKGKFLFHHVQSINNLNPQFYHQMLKNFIQNIQQSQFKQSFINLKQQQIQSTLQNLRFTQNYFNQTYHNEANKLTELKQNIKKLYQSILQKLQQKMNFNIKQIEKYQNLVKNHFQQNIKIAFGMKKQTYILLNLLGNQQNKNKLNKQNQLLLKERLDIIQDKLFQIQNQSDQCINISTYDYKINQNSSNIQHFIKNFDILKIRKTQQQGKCTHRSSMKSNMKTSRATSSRLSSNRMTNSKDNRVNSSFKRNQNISSNKQNNSSFKPQSNQKGYMKNSVNSTTMDQNRKSMSRSINKTNIIQQSCNSSRNNSAFFKQTNLKNIKDLQKVQHQDLNLNLKKLIKNKNNLHVDDNSRIKEQQSFKISQKTSLQKKQQQKNGAIKNSVALSKQNQKSTINSGSLLKIFQNNKSGVSARKNYLVNSAQELDQSNFNSKSIVINKFQLNNSHANVKSPQNKNMNRKTTIKNQIIKLSKNSVQNTFSSINTSKLIQNRSPQQKSTSNNKNIENSMISKNQHTSQKSGNSGKSYSVIFDNLIAVSCQRQNQISQFNTNKYQSAFTSTFRIQNIDTIGSSKISNYSEIQLNTFTQPKYSDQSEFKASIPDIQLVKSVRLNQRTDTQQNSNNSKSRRQSLSNKNSSIDNKKHDKIQLHQLNKQKVHSLVVNPQISQFKYDISTNKIFKDSTNIMKLNKNTLKNQTENKTHNFSNNNSYNYNQNTILNNLNSNGLNSLNNNGNVQKQKLKKKPDFLDMRQKMRKPNYLSSRLASNNVNKGFQISNKLK